MSWLDDIGDFASSALDWLGGNTIGAQIVRTAGTGFLLNKITSAVSKENDATRPEQLSRTADPYEPDKGVRVQVNADMEHRVPVVYGTAYLGGIITDAVLTNSDQTMGFCLTICEQTGSLWSTDANSQIDFLEIYWDDGLVSFENDGFTVNHITDRDGNVDNSLGGLVRIYCYSGNSESPVVPSGYTNNALDYAYDIFPDWTADHMMNDLIFVLVAVDYNKEKGSTKLGNINFKMRNTLTLPGDVMFDYLTSSRYGAGVSEEEIYTV
jgi:hypothetical protein